MSLKASELRLGNLIEFDSGLSPKETIVINARFFSGLAGGKSNEEVTKLSNKDLSGYHKPIPLTEEWLTKCGFDFVSGYYGHSHLPDIYFDKTFEPAALSHDGQPIYLMVNEMKYVHQLQNLYFALTGEELKYEG
jgi:hypothetical protein